MMSATSSAQQGVTVVIPAFNAGRFIADALASIAAQSRPADEVIVVDDGSTDDTVEIAELWADRLPLRVIRCAQNGGAGVARRVAIEAASNPFIANLDADDRWCPDHLETAMPFAGPTTIVATKCTRVRADGVGGDSVEPASIPHPDEQVDEILRSNFLFSGSVYPAALLLDPAIGFSLLRTAQDWDTWIRLIVLGGARATLAPHATVIKTSHTSSVSAGADYISADVGVYASLAADERYRQWHAAIPAHVRRREARASMIDAAEFAAQGQSMEARRHFLRAAMTDRSLRGGRQRAGSGSVTIRAIVGVVSPSFFVRWRESRAAASGTVTGGG